MSNTCPPTVSSEVEVRVVVQVLRLNTLSKLTFADRQRFDALVRDVFTGVEFRDVEYGALEAALREASKQNNLVIIDRQVELPACISACVFCVNGVEYNQFSY